MTLSFDRTVTTHRQEDRTAVAVLAEFQRIGVSRVGVHRAVDGTMKMSEQRVEEASSTDLLNAKRGMRDFPILLPGEPSVLRTVKEGYIDARSVHVKAVQKVGRIGWRPVRRTPECEAVLDVYR